MNLRKIAINTFKTKMTTQQCCDTGMAMVLLLLILFVFLKREGLVASAIMAHILNMTYPRAYAPVAVVWLGTSQLLGMIMSRILLSMVFFGVVTPVGILRRFLGKDSLKLSRFKMSGESVMLERNHMLVARDLERPY